MHAVDRGYHVPGAAQGAGARETERLNVMVPYWAIKPNNVYGYGGITVWHTCCCHSLSLALLNSLAVLKLRRFLHMEMVECVMRAVCVFGSCGLFVRWGFWMVIFFVENVLILDWCFFDVRIVVFYIRIFAKYIIGFKY